MNNHRAFTELQVQQQIIKIIKDSFLHLRDKKISVDTPLFNGGAALNSTQMIELTLALETYFSIDVEPDDLVPENFQNVRILSYLVSTKYIQPFCNESEN